MFVPLSIPSPSAAWQYFDVTAWLNSTFGASLPGSLRIHAYAICILVGIVAAVVITNHRLNRQGAEKGIVIVSWVWQAGGVASRERPLYAPADAKGLKVRGGSREMDLMMRR